MTTHAVEATRWATSAYPDAADTLPGDLTALGDHVATCSGSRSRWFSLQCAAEAAHAFIAARFVTTLAIVLFTFGASALML